MLSKGSNKKISGWMKFLWLNPTAREHVLLWIEKRNTNTDWVAGLLARLAKVSRRDVGYAGKKDRRALTRQWFRCACRGIQEPD